VRCHKCEQREGVESELITGEPSRFHGHRLDPDLYFRGQFFSGATLDQGPSDAGFAEDFDVIAEDLIATGSPAGLGGDLTPGI